MVIIPVRKYGVFVDICGISSRRANGVNSEVRSSFLSPILTPDPTQLWTFSGTSVPVRSVWRFVARLLAPLYLCWPTLAPQGAVSLVVQPALKATQPPHTVHTRVW